MVSVASCLSRVIVLVAAIAISVSSHSWEEEGVVYGSIGGAILLRCDRHNDSPAVQWRFNGSPNVPWGFLTPHHDLQIFNLSLSIRGNYTCHHHTGELLSAVRLITGHPPGIPSVSCRASDFHNFSCDWRPSVETLLPTRYIATYRVDKGVPDVCVQDPSRPNACVVHRFKPWTVYRMNITEVNPLGSNFRIMEFTVQSIIKPDPPEILSAEPIPFAPRRLRVTWAYPATWPQEPHFQLRFRLQYRPVIHPYWSVMETANLSDVITDAFVGVEHILQVSARDFLDAGNWSEWSEEARATPWTSKEASADIPEISSETTTEESDYKAEDPFVQEMSNDTTTEEPEPEVKPVADFCCTADPSDSTEKVAMLVSMGIFAFVVLALFLIIGALVWVKVGRTMKDGTIKPDFLTVIHMKALPKTQIL